VAAPHATAAVHGRAVGRAGEHRTTWLSGWNGCMLPNSGHETGIISDVAFSCEQHTALVMLRR
jgi:hypothetical protein